MTQDQLPADAAARLQPIPTINDVASTDWIHATPNDRLPRWYATTATLPATATNWRHGFR